MKLTIKNIDYTYQNNRSQQILNNISYDFELNKVYAICGASGSGKTTLLSLIAGLDEPQKGKITLNNKDIKIKGYRYHRKENVSLIFQNYNLIDYMTPLENIRLINPRADKQILLDLGIGEDDMHRNVLQLSGGQQQRVAIARSLASSAPFILADEPTGNLDEENALKIMHILKEAACKNNKGVIIVTHSQNIAKQADITLALNKRGLKEL